MGHLDTPAALVGDTVDGHAQCNPSLGQGASATGPLVGSNVRQRFEDQPKAIDID
jgi:hypothetical protein